MSRTPPRSDHADAAQPELLTSRELAELLRQPLRTIYEWNRQGTGPARYRVGRHVLYRRSDVEEWLTGLRVDPPAPRQSA